MSEIEKMYENAGVKQDRMCEWTCKDSDLCNPNCEHYRSTQLYYPPFTAEKQIELIKWLSEIDCTVRIDFDKNEWGVATENYGGYFCDNFSDALVSIINELWQDLTPKEKQQVKGILE